MNVQMNHCFLPFFLLGSDYLVFLLPQTLLESLSHLEYYKSVFPPAEVQERAVFSVSWRIVCLGKYTI